MLTCGIFRYILFTGYVYIYTNIFICVHRDKRDFEHIRANNNFYNARFALNIPFANQIIRILCCCKPAEIAMFLDA